MTVLAVAEEAARSIAGVVAPARLALALTRPRMAHFGITPVAVTNAGAVRAVPVGRADALPTVDRGPPVRAGTLAIGRITGCPVLAAARLRAVDTVLAGRARVETLGTHKTGRTDALARHPVAVGPVEALAPIRTLQPVQTRLAAVGADRAGVPGRTNTLTRYRIARSAVLAATLGLALRTVRARGTRFRAEWSGESCRAVTLPRDVVALAAVLALANLGAVLPEAIAGARFLAVAALEAALARTASVGGVADRVVGALAPLRAVRAPQIQWTLNITALSGVSLVAPADVRFDALTIPAARLTLRHAVHLIVAQHVPDAALLHDALLDDGARFVHRSNLDPVRRAAGRNAEAPLLVPLLVRLLPWRCYRDGDVLDLLAHVRPLQVVILDDFGEPRDTTVGAGREQY